MDFTNSEKNQMQLITNGLITADRFINKNYLINLSENKVLPIDDHMKNSTSIRLYRVEKLVYDKKENINDKLISVYSSLFSIGSSALLIINGNKKDVEFYLGIRANNSASVAGAILEKSFLGNFSGSSLYRLRNPEISNIMDSCVSSSNIGSLKNLSCVTVVPSMPVASFNDEHGQNAERLEKQNRISEYTKIEKATDANGEVNVYRMANDYFSKIDAIKADSRMSESEKIKALTSLGENVTVINNDFRESVETDMRDLYTEEYRVRREFYETHNIINAMETNMSVKSDISENESLESTLFLFEQSQWENISIYEKKVAIDKLCDCITEDLGINEKPEIRYYNGDISESGGYSREKNAIYINENTLISGCDVADTVAHEARHCWQHERAENPQNEQDYRFKESIENYVKPELNYEKYSSQSMEIDARDYASKITENISKYIEPKEETPYAEQKEKYGASHQDLNPERDAVFDKPDLPADFEAKTLTDDQRIKEVAPYIYGLDDFKDHLKPIYMDANRTPQEKFEYALKLYHAIPEGQRTDINVVNNFKAIRTDQESLENGRTYGYLPVAFHEYHGLDENKDIYGIEKGKALPEILCRRGGESGNNLTEPHKDGSVPSVDELSIPYEENKEAVHYYKTDANAYKEAIDIIASVDKNNLTEKAQEMNALIEKLNGKYDLNNVPLTETDMQKMIDAYNRFQHDDNTGLCMDKCQPNDNESTKYGVCGTVAPMHVDNDISKEKLYNGGAPQYNPPCSIKTLVDIGIFHEISKDDIYEKGDK